MYCTTRIISVCFYTWHTFIPTFYVHYQSLVTMSKRRDVEIRRKFTCVHKYTRSHHLPRILIQCCLTFKSLAKSIAPVEVFYLAELPEHRIVFCCWLAETRALDDETNDLLEIPMRLTFVVRKVLDLSPTWSVISL
jgi:hypothetical protein